MKRRISRVRFASLCTEVGPEDGVDPRYAYRPNARRPHRKGLQLCRQIARAISHALSWELGKDVLSQVQIDSVEPAPNTSRVAVFVSFDPSIVSREAIETELVQAAAPLRAAAASAINRRRVPDLAYVVVPRTPQ
jgi:ribosome-binding factor A